MFIPLPRDGELDKKFKVFRSFFLNHLNNFDFSLTQEISFKKINTLQKVSRFFWGVGEFVLCIKYPKKICWLISLPINRNFL